MEDLIRQLETKFSDYSFKYSDFEVAFEIHAKNFLEGVAFLKDNLGFSMLLDMAAVDWETDVFSIYYHFLNPDRAIYARVELKCKESVPSLTSFFGSANWQERECYDMMGIRFKGHPDLTRILMWEGFLHHPLRKSFPVAGVEQSFPDSDVAELAGVQLETADQQDGPFLAAQGATASSREPCPREVSL